MKYYYISIRLSKILGFISQLLLFNSSFLDKFKEIIELIYEKHPNHLISLSDIQTTCLYVFFKELNKNKLLEEGKRYLAKYTSDFLGQGASFSS